MATITVLRPSTTSSGVGWSAVPSGTLHGVTSDDNDSTYALWSGDGAALILGTPLDAPPTGERRHLVRVRARGSLGSAWWAVRLASGGLVAGASGSFGGTPETIIGSWQAGAPADGSTVLSAYVAGQSTGVRIVELFVDVDTRAAPDFTPQILDGSGTSTVTVTDTVTPSIRVSALDLDGLPVRQYRYQVWQDGGLVWDTGVVSGAPVDRTTPPLPNGTYTARLQVWSTLGSNTAYASDVEEIEFTMAVGAVPAPSAPSVTPEEPFYRVEVCAPDMTEFDGDQGWVEIQRVDCPIGGYLSLIPGPAANPYASTPDSAPLDITGDLQVTVFAQRDDDWRPESTDQTLISKYLTTGNQRSWRVSLDWDGADNGGGPDEARAGRPFLAWSPDGTVGSLEVAFADERAPIDPFGRVHLRVFLDVQNGSGNWEVTFEVMDEDGVWQPLGNPIEGSGATSIFSGSADLTVGAYSGGTIENFEGRIYSAEVRSGQAGPVVASPDFTGHPAGTMTFDDDQGNTWTISGGATLVTSQQITTVAILGPLETDECAEWTDFTVPRGGVGRSCDHEPDPCCSYWRARTVGRVDGAVLVSDWSDAFNPGIAPGVIFAWPGSAASLPAGWTRTTELDNRYLKGVPDGSTQPGSTGGATNHNHTTPGHTHDIDHAHDTDSDTGSGVGSVSMRTGSAATVGVALSHTHTRPGTATATVASGSASPGSNAVANDPDRLSVVWMESNGVPVGVPNGALALMPDISPSGWDTYADATNRFLKGAAPAGDGGAVAAGSLATHTHQVAAHTHGGTSHSHTSLNTGSVASNLTANFAGTTTEAIAHSHPVTIAAGNTAALDSGTGGTSGSTTPNEPPYRNLRVRQNVSGSPDLPVGVVGAWLGSLGTIPTGWALCDGTGGTPDLLGLYPRGATASINATGGGTAGHTHTSPSDHTHTSSGHSHASTVGAPTSTVQRLSGGSPTASAGSGTHTHSLSNTEAAQPVVDAAGSGTLASAVTEPPHTEVAFIQLVEAIEPPPEPETFCLTWNEDEHLIRTLTPDGPLYVGVIGLFEWAVERPFTSATGVMGGRFVTSAPPGGRNLRMVAAVESEADLAALRAVLARPLVLVSPSDSSEVWAAPIVESVRIIKVDRIREVRADFIATGPEPAPQVADVGA